jgi:hypothetical protein
MHKRAREWISAWLDSTLVLATDKGLTVHFVTELAVNWGARRSLKDAERHKHDRPEELLCIVMK